ncbi:MAG TPA: hypothetical protein VF250_06665 [Conexibacter sp.]
MTAVLHVLDVGHGNCALACGEDWTVMVDAAPDPAVVETVEQLALRRLDTLVVSHRDRDHARGVVPLLSDRKLEIGCLYVPADAAKDPTTPETALLLAALGDAKRSGRCRVSRDLDDSLPEGTLDGGGLIVEVLAPTYATAMTGPRGRSPAGGTITSNGASAVLRITLPDGLRVLLPGDADHVTFEDLARVGADLSAEVLVFPHHGSHSVVPDEDRFARDVMLAVRPQTVLFSVSRQRRGRPTEAVLRGVLQADANVYVACTQLSRGCLSSDEDLPRPADLGHLASLPASGRSSCQSCAGSMTLSGTGLSAPDSVAHQAYVTTVAHRPLCRTLRPAREDRVAQSQ